MMRPFTRERVNKELELITAQLERYGAMRANISLTCLKCGLTIKDPYDAIIHSSKCQFEQKKEVKFEQPPKEPHRLY